MNQMNQLKHDEIDFFELFKTLWDGKWIICTLVVTFFLLGGSIIFFKKPVYESKLFLSLNNVPPNFGEQDIYIVFKKMFFSKKLFKDWKDSNSNTTIEFEDFSSTEIINGFSFLKSEDDQLANIKFKQKGKSFVLVKTNQLPLIFDFVNYSNHINDVLTREYILHEKVILNKVNSISNNPGFLAGEMINTIVKINRINRFINLANQGQTIFEIQNPTIPKKVSPRSKLVLALFVTIGGIIGVFFVFIRDAIIKRKENG